MGVNKVDLANGETLIDLQNDTVTPETLAKGVTAHNAKGEPIVGTMVAGEGGSGGPGIIEVPELPTENIVENAVYKVTNTPEVDVYAVIGEIKLSLKESYNAQIYIVDELPAEMQQSTNSALYCYILKENFIVYVNYRGVGVTTVGTLLQLADRGHTEDIENEDEDGVYVVGGIAIETWFERKNGEWKRISADKQLKRVTLSKNGKESVEPDSGKVLSRVDITVSVSAFGDLMDDKIEHVTEEHFLRKDGKYCSYIRAYAFYDNSALRTLTIPSETKYIYNNVTMYSGLETVTFKGKPAVLNMNAFHENASLGTINVPWSEGEILYAPWGATNATINYNYTGE